MTIEEVSRRARAEGISYGQYVFRHRVELAGKRPEPTEGLTSAVRCPNCEKYFTPNNKTQKFAVPPAVLLTISGTGKRNMQKARL